MNRKHSRTATLLAGMVGLAGCQGVDNTIVSAFPRAPTATEAAIAAYRAPAPGTRFVYRDSFAGKVNRRVETVMAPGDDISGGLAVVFQNETGKSMIRKGTGNLIAEASVATDTVESYAPEQGLLRFPMKPGDSWQARYERTVVGADDTEKRDVSATVRVLGYETITVPAGKFRALKLHARTEERATPLEKPAPGGVMYWFVEELGVNARMIFYDGRETVLEKIERPRA